MAVNFSTDSSAMFYIAKDAVKHVDSSSSSKHHINEFYEISRCVKWIKDSNFKEVALQFPDDLLHDADKIALRIQKQTSDSHIYVLADTSYGSCCVDEVAAEHVQSDALIHFGSACLTPCSRLPVLYIFGTKGMDCEHVSQEFSRYAESCSKDIILMYDVTYSHAAPTIFDQVSSQYPRMVLSNLVIPGSDNSGVRDDVEDGTYVVTVGGRICRLPKGNNLNDYVIFYIGNEGPALTNLLMTLNKCEFLTYDPSSKKIRREHLNVNKALCRRYYLIERAKDAHIIGVLVGTLGVTGYLDIIERVRAVAKNAGKRTYTIVVGRLNPSKLANFPEVDVFVLVACSENSLLDNKEFYKPVITPFEFELACNEAREWTGEYTTDFRELMPGSSHYKALIETSEGEEPRTSVSLISGRINRLLADSSTRETTNGSLLSTDSTVANIHERAGGEFLINRSWHGLEQNLGKDTAAIVQPGKLGTASGYEHEVELVK